MNNPAPMRRDAAAFKIRRAKRHPALYAKARAFTVWREANRHGGDLSLADLADIVNMPLGEVRNIVRSRGWGNLLRGASRDEEPADLADLLAG